MRGRRGFAGSQPMSAVHGAQINFGDVTHYLTYICLQMSNNSAYQALNENEFNSNTVKNLGNKKQVFVHTFTLLKNLLAK
jgi:hypothetical protein